MTEKQYMACGHAANGVMDGKPVCVICYGIRPGADEVVGAPDLAGREARCIYCGRTVPSEKAMAFFEYHPNAQYDSHYDGCRGWE